MLPSPLRIFVFSSVLLLAACSTAPKKGQPLPTPHPSSQPEKNVLYSPEKTPALKAGEYAIWVESDPKGGIVVIDGTPVGRTPQQIVVNGTARGFFHDNVSIKVRFVATDSDHTSQTVEEVLTPLDKIPARVRFTAQGAMRVAR
ncbi:MAG: PEGA domain-containing protein [Nibricoccus sp.]